jgi:hypothetical protein
MLLKDISMKSRQQAPKRVNRYLTSVVIYHLTLSMGAVPSIIMDPEIATEEGEVQAIRRAGSRAAWDKVVHRVTSTKETVLGLTTGATEMNKQLATNKTAALITLWSAKDLLKR